MYRLDGRLIAMSVLDLLPRAVSGVYFTYHSDFEKWSFGKLSALREAALAVEEGYDLYYMGYFIWSCRKMRYKGDYKPQNVLDYDTLQWHVMNDDMKRLMDKRKWVSMSREKRIARATQETGHKSDSEPESTHEEEVAAQFYKVEYENPVAAMNSDRSVLELNLPGAMSLQQVLDEVSLDDMIVTLGRGTVYKMQDIVSWASGSVLDPTTLKGMMAELAACTGPKLAKETTVDFSRDKDVASTN